MTTGRRLVIAPHVDDDVIGCGGILDETTTVLYIGVDEHHVVSADERRREAMAVAYAVDSDKLGYRFLWPTGEFKVNNYAKRLNDLIELLERAISDERPDEVLLPWPSYNQDHRAVYDAALVALRPHDKIPMVNRVLLYEEPESFWPHGLMGQFQPNLYRLIDVERKVMLYELMKSQVRGHRSSDMIRHLSYVRGAAIMSAQAEAYHILRWVE